MSVSDLLLIVGVIAVAVFGFLNGWALRRSVAGASVPVPPPVDADDRSDADVTADLVVTAVDGEIETYQEEALTAVADLHDEYVTDTNRGDDRSVDASEAQLRGVDEFRRVEAELAARRFEVCDLKDRVAQLDDLEDRLRARDTWLTDTQARHRADLHKKDVELARCESLIGDLSDALAEFRGLQQVVTEMESLERRLADAEESRRARTLEHDAALIRKDAEIERLRGQLATANVAAERNRPGSLFDALNQPPRKGTTGRFKGVVPNPSGLPDPRLRQHSGPV